jgi:beta-lactamase regulating signal transducer with metallopeptidase domain
MMTSFHEYLEMVPVMSSSPIAHNLAAFILAAAIKSLPLLMAAAVLSAFLRRSPAAARHMVWLVAIGGLFFLPLFSLWQPRLPRPLQRPLTVSSPFVEAVTSQTTLSPERRSVPAGYQVSQGPFKPIVRDWRSIVPRDVVTVAAAPSRLRPVGEAAWWSKNQQPFLGAWIFLTWLAVALALTLRLVLSIIVARRIASSCLDVTHEAYLALVRDAARRLGGTPRVAIRIGRREAVPAVPMTIGLIVPTVLLPRGAAQWPQDRLEAALLHELAHVRRRDWAGLILASLACALYWFNPLVWYAARRLRVESEMACDDQVLIAGAPAVDYAGHLLEMARSLSTAKPGVPTAVAAITRPQIEGRLKAILDRARSRGALSRRARAFAFTFAIILLVPLALLRFQSRATAHLRPLADAVGKDLSRIAPSAEALTISHPTKGTLAMLSLKPLVGKASAALAGLSLLATPIPADAQDTAAAAPPASPVAATPSPDTTPVPPPPASSDSTVTITAPSMTVTPPPPGSSDTKIQAPDATVIYATPSQPKTSQTVPSTPSEAPAAITIDGLTGKISTGLANNYTLRTLLSGQQDGLPVDAVQRRGQNSYDIDVTKAPVEALIAKLCQTAGVNCTIGSNIEGLVTVYLHNFSFDNALQSIIRASDTPLTYSVEGGVYHIEKRQVPQVDEDAMLPHKNVILDLDSAPFDKALKDLCDGAHASYTMVSNDDKSITFNAVTSHSLTAIAPSGQTTVTVHLHDVPFPAALRALLNATSPALTYSVKDGIIYIRPAAQSWDYSVVVPDVPNPTTFQWQEVPLSNDQATDRLIQQSALAKPLSGQDTDRLIEQGVPPIPAK